jgi:hypothetical protein
LQSLRLLAGGGNRWIPHHYSGSSCHHSLANRIRLASGWISFLITLEKRFDHFCFDTIVSRLPLNWFILKQENR